MVIGPVGAGKSTLLTALGLGLGSPRKTQTLTYLGRAIDTPGEMLALPRYYNALILNSARARLVLFLMDGSRPSPLPARLALALKAPVAGVVSKVDASDPGRLIRAENALRGAGVELIFQVSAVTGAGLAVLKKWLGDFPVAGQRPLKME
jgi:ethanolamine utilization protein EutP